MSETNEAYMAGRQQYKSGRPQAIVWLDNEPQYLNNKIIPVGYEIGAEVSTVPSEDLIDNRFLILSDHNRGELGINIERIEQKRRMVNGTMRSYHVADKRSVSISWDMLPSRSFKKYPNFSVSGKPDLQRLTEDQGNPPKEVPVVPYGSQYFADQKHTVDGGAGGVELLDWYENHTGPFWVMLSYDKYDSLNTSDIARNGLSEYSQVLQMYISSFDYSVVKRGSRNFDMWNISVQLEEV
jgi:hypothetical protein